MKGVGVMRNRSILTIWMVVMLIASFMGIFISSGLLTFEAHAAPPILYEANAWPQDSDIMFTVYYEDADNDSGSVVLNLDGNGYPMEGNIDEFPEEGQYFYRTVPTDIITDDSEFYFFAEDASESTNLGSQEYPFLVGDFTGWGEPPVLSNPSVYDDGDWVFNITYQDPIDGDDAYHVDLILYIDNEDVYYPMETEDPDPRAGQNFIARVPEENANEFTEFYFEADDVNGSYTDLYDYDGEYYDNFVIGILLQENGGNENGNGNGDGSSQGFALPDWLNNAEVVVGIIGLVAIGAGSAYGVYRRKKKHGRFSELLTKMDEIYGSFKTNPKRCELELEKMRGTINEDLKKSTIDDNNYSILKGRIDEILGEIRSESLRTEVAELPKDIELKIKDMLIDGEITRAEYDKILPIIKGSSMTSDEKEKVKKMVESYMVEEKKE
jgi:hypothetical protein